MTHGMEHWHPDPEFFFKPGGGPILDMAPYYLSALVNLIGPVKRVFAMASSRGWACGDRRLAPQGTGSWSRRPPP